MSTLAERNILNYNLIETAETTGKYQLPRLRPSPHLAFSATRFSEITGDTSPPAAKKQKWVHFYAHDKTFNAIWNTPHAYLEKLRQYAGVITPDFSLYSPLTFTMQLWNTHRNRALAHWLKENNINIIPNISWGLKNSYEFCFDGIEPSSNVAISTIGSITNRAARLDYKNGLAEMLSRLTPTTVHVYGTMPLDIFAKYLHKTQFIRIPHTFKTARVAEIVAETSEHRFALENEIIEKLSTESLEDLIMEKGKIIV